MTISDLVCFKKEECLRPHLVKSITLVCKGCEIAVGSHTIQTVPKYIWMQQCYRIYFIVAGRGGAVPTKNGTNPSDPHLIKPKCSRSSLLQLFCIFPGPVLLEGEGCLPCLWFQKCFLN